MSTPNTGFLRECDWVESLPDADGDCYFYQAGKQGFLRDTPPADWPKVTRITLLEDVPGLHCDMRRVCVWSGEKLLAELPYTSVKVIGYMP